MRIYHDLDSGVILQNEGFARQHNLQNPVTMKRGDTSSIEIGFVRGLSGRELLPAGSIVTVGMKEQGRFEGEFIVSGSTSTAPDDASGFYSVEINLNTIELNALLARDDDDSNDIESVLLMLEISIYNNGSITSSNTSFARIDNDVISGNEGAPETATPAFPPTASINQAITDTNLNTAEILNITAETDSNTAEILNLITGVDSNTAEITSLSTIKRQMKTLSTDITSNNSNVSDLGFSNLVVGNVYQINYSLVLRATGSEGSLRVIVTNGATNIIGIMRIDNNPSGTIYSGGANYGIQATLSIPPFVATDSNITASTSLFVSGAVLVGDGSNAESHAVIYELPTTLAETTEF